MTAIWLPEDEPFFREWKNSRQGIVRSLERARLFAAELGLDLSSPPLLLTVVGSKGKGTTVAHAAATLYASGLKVGSITSPAFRLNSERIRINGIALNRAEYRKLSQQVARTLEALPPDPTGYLSPTGAFTLSGANYLINQGVEVLVIEEGMGGISDEVSLFAPTVVAVTPIFEEHIGVIGDNKAEVTKNLLGVIRSDKTEVVCSGPQDLEVSAIIRSVVNSAQIRLHILTETSKALKATAHLSGFNAENAALGVISAEELIQSKQGLLDQQRLDETLRSIRLPGRLSVHSPKGVQQTWIVDAAISPNGVKTALNFCRKQFGEPSLVIASFPDGKDAVGCFAALEGTNFVAARAGDHLSFSAASITDWVSAQDAFVIAGKETGVILCLGTISFISEVLEYLDVQTDRFW